MIILKDAAYHPLGQTEDAIEGEYIQRFSMDPPPEHLSADEGYWQTAGGHLLKISEMSTQHLDNVIKIFEHHGWGDHDKIQELREERGRR